MRIPKEWKEGNARGTTEKNCPWCHGKYTDYQNHWKLGVVEVSCAKNCGYRASFKFGELSTDEVIRYLMKKRPML